MVHPQRILEVTINSAHGLPPMSKLLHTFVVVWVNPENKLNTRVDQHGNTNPKWNCKLVFRVDDHFLWSESSIIMMEIYNVAWLRDLPMGTTRLKIGQLLKNLNKKNHSMQNIVLPIHKASSGQVHGTLNVSVNVIGGYPTPSSPPKEEATTPPNTSRNASIKANQQTLNEMLNSIKSKVEKTNQNKTTKTTFSRSNSMTDMEKDTEISPITDSTRWNIESDPKSRVISSNDSLSSTMKPLPSEIALDFKKGCYYYQSSESSKMNNLFENWTESGGAEGMEIDTLRPKSLRLLGVDDHVNLLENNGGKQIKKKKKSGNEKGIMSCFGNACGFQFKILCGSKVEKKKKRNKYESKSPVFKTSEQNLRRLYF